MADVIADVIRHAQKLAEEAPPLSTEQALLLVSVFSRYTTEDDENPTTYQGVHK
ncbi:MAG TPA: hypothetical protein VN255_14560 [Mycobacterium sp.]|nr:hypothetical protein [Mycobacterium sp.]